MKQDSIGSKAYLGAIMALRNLINEEYRNGGWLPSGRDMAKRLNVSHPTYCKALKFIEKEGIATSYPKKGHYIVPNHLWCKKVGLIINMGEESPFVRQDAGISKAMDYLYSHGYDSHIIQGSSLDQLYENALIHGMEGIIWFAPLKKAAEEINNIRKDGKVPLLVVQLSDYDVDFGTGSISYDFSHSSQNRVNSITKLGHKKIAYIGYFNNLESSGILSKLKTAGINITPEYCISDILNNPGSVNKLVTDEGVTGILSEGGSFRINSLFSELSQLPKSKQPDVIVSHFPQLKQLHKMYPKVKLISNKNELKGNLGEEAAKMLIKHIKEGIPLEQRKIGFA